MEVTINYNHQTIWLDEKHPNFIRWQRARQLSVKRGEFVYSLIKRHTLPKNLFVLDLGSGEGGTSRVFAKNNFVVSFDLNFLRLKRQHNSNNSDEFNFSPERNYSHSNDQLNNKGFTTNFSSETTAIFNQNKFSLVNGNAEQLPFADDSFDLIIIQDVIEHLINIQNFYSEIKRVLKENGMIYLSTPNKLSLLNLLNDPHFGLPVVSVLNRKSIKKYFLKYFRKDDYKRRDIAQLLSLKKLIKLFQKDFEISLNTKFSVFELFNGNKGIVWSDFHLKLISFCRLINIHTLLIKIANDKFGSVNKYFTPTFYFILKRTSHELH